jgi:hypothetical protein
VTAESRAAKLLLLDVALIGALKLAIDAWVLHAGFTHVSDDDYARTVIAEQFAHRPRLDPSGTSWLPLPFWVAGAAMALVGRSLAVARAIAIAIAAMTVGAPYAAMRVAGMPRLAASAATVITMALPWNAWLGVATVPDGWAGALVAAGVIAMIEPRARPWAAAAVLVASLSRYEAWPGAAALAAFCGVRAARDARSAAGSGSASLRRNVACALVALAGPAIWMAWNAHAHGSAFHFVTRVSAFRRAIGAADVSFYDKLFDYPRALVVETPEVAALGVLGVAGLATSVALRRRWTWPALACLTVFAFLVLGDLGDGAPTHHPARALAVVWWVLAGMGVDAIATAVSASRRGAVRVAAACATGAAAIAWMASLPARWSAAPGQGDLERRDAQIARGIELRERDVSTAEITPCEFEHFALIAAWGEPERARVNPRTREPPTIACPHVMTP